MEQRFFITPDDLSRRLRKKIERRGLVGLRGFGTLLRQSEENGSQIFDLNSELPKVLSDFGVFMNHTEVVEMKRILGSDTDGQVTLLDFVEFLAPELNETRKNIVEKAFTLKDTNNNGLLSIEEIRNISHYQSSAVTLLAVKQMSPEALFQNLIQVYEKEQTASIPKEEFLDYYRLISPEIANDFEFVTMVKTSWGI